MKRRILGLVIVWGLMAGKVGAQTTATINSETNYGGTTNYVTAPTGQGVGGACTKINKLTLTTDLAKEQFASARCVKGGMGNCPEGFTLGYPTNHVNDGWGGLNKDNDDDYALCGSAPGASGSAICNFCWDWDSYSRSTQPTPKPVATQSATPVSGATENMIILAVIGLAVIGLGVGRLVKV
jgi:hypothetical protein